METELLHSRGTPTPGEPVLVMYCYPNDYDDDTEVGGEIKKGLTEMSDQLYNQTALDYYEINKAYPRPNINITGSGHQEKRDDFWIKFRDWVKAQGYDSYKGLHLGVANEFSGGVASGGEDGNSAFSSGSSRIYSREPVLHHF